MNKPTGPDFFNKDAAKSYDEKNAKLSKISDCMHFLTGLALRDLPADARILCVGAGTGAEILPLAQANPGWKFVALEPSLDMLNICRERMAQADVSDRCEFVHGYVQDYKGPAEFDAALSILVAHFIKREERLPFFKEMTARLKRGGYLVNAEISFDLDSPEFPMMLEGWKGVQTLMGATPESLAALPTVLRDVLTVVPPEQTEAWLRQAGVESPVRFFQAMMIHGTMGKKS
jgi:Methylase involved in ubiquinone/menaquinone biosynthesis